MRGPKRDDDRRGGAPRGQGERRGPARSQGQGPGRPQPQSGRFQPGRAAAPVAAYRLLVEYDGGRYQGWQKQGQGQLDQGVRTIANALERALEEQDLTVRTLMGSGRTDAGVHALGQVAHLHLDAQGAPSPQRLLRIFEEGLPADIAVREAVPCPPGFHARHDAVARSYVYQLSLRRSAFGKPYLWWVKRPLDLAKLARAWKAFEGFHDVTAFADLGPQDDPRCEVQRCELVEHGSLVLLRVTASHFLRRQARRMVGAAVACALGDEDPARILKDLQRPTDRAALEWSERAAPSAGLFLERVQYAGDPGPGPLRPLIEVP